MFRSDLRYRSRKYAERREVLHMVTDEEVQDTGQKAKKLEMSEKEITFLETTKFTKRPHLLFPVVVFIIQWIP